MAVLVSLKGCELILCLIFTCARLNNNNGGSEGMTTTIQVLVIWGALPDSRGVHVATEVFSLVLGLAPAPWR